MGEEADKLKQEANKLFKGEGLHSNGGLQYT